MTPSSVRIETSERRDMGQRTVTGHVAAGIAILANDVHPRCDPESGTTGTRSRAAALRNALAHERTDPSYQKKLDAGRRRRAVAEVAYVEDFRAAILAFLAFHPRYQLAARAMADRITAHATPVGSGTVARTQRIPIEQRAEAATIAWMRHQTTGYDSMQIARIKGERRAVRRQLAQRSQHLLARYREGLPIDVSTCPLHAAITA